MGFHGLKKKIDGVSTECYQLHIGASVSDSDNSIALARTEADWIIPADKLGVFIYAVFKSFINSYMNNEVVSVKEFMSRLKNCFCLADYI